MRFDEDEPPRGGGGGPDDPKYRISFWDWAGTLWRESWVNIDEADADEVLAWAADNARGRHYTVWVRTIQTDATGHIRCNDVRLVGTEPVFADGMYPAWARRHSREQGPPTRPTVPPAAPPTFTDERQPSKDDTAN